MKIIKPSFVFLDDVDGDEVLSKIEKAGRTCYKSEGQITSVSARRFVSGILKSGHESVIEHHNLSVKIICDRGISHEIVRHRIASYSQESTRYCNYTQAKFGNELTFIKPFFWKEDSDHYALWKAAMQNIEDSYNKLIAAGAKAEEARSILPNSLKTEIVVTMNLREWRHFFRLRTSKASHPQMREIACAMLQDFKAKIPVLFDDIAGA
jgi:thymidylate synthase (FAD)